LQIVVREMALRFSRHLQELLIGYSLKPPRVFREEEDVKYVVADYRECRKLFADFGLEIKDKHSKNIKAKKLSTVSDSNSDAKEKEKESKEMEKEKENEKEVEDNEDDEEVDDTEDPFYPYTRCVEAMQKSTVSLMQLHMVSMAQRNEQQKEERKRKEKEQGVSESVLGRPKAKGKSKKRGNKKKALSAMSRGEQPSVRAKGIKDRAVIKSIYNDPILHILAHRAEDEEALSYVENFVQYRHALRPLMIDLSNIENTLRVIIHEGRGLPALDFTGKSDPFCKVQLMPFKLKEQTRVVRQTLRPKWDEPLDFQVKNDKQRHRHIMIEIECWDWDTIGSDDFIGKHTERIEFGQANVVEKWIELFQSNNHNTPQGQLLITVECENLWNM